MAARICSPLPVEAGRTGLIINALGRAVMLCTLQGSSIHSDRNKLYVFLLVIEPSPAPAPVFVQREPANICVGARDDERLPVVDRFDSPELLVQPLCWTNRSIQLKFDEPFLRAYPAV